MWQPVTAALPDRRRHSGAPDSGGCCALVRDVNGAVTKRAARVRLLFDLGTPPLDLEPIQAGNRFPVNFLADLRLAEEVRATT